MPDLTGTYFDFCCNCIRQAPPGAMAELPWLRSVLEGMRAMLVLLPIETGLWSPERTAMWFGAVQQFAIGLHNRGGTAEERDSRAARALLARLAASRPKLSVGSSPDR